MNLELRAAYKDIQKDIQKNFSQIKILNNMVLPNMFAIPSHNATLKQPVMKAQQLLKQHTKLTIIRASNKKRHHHHVALPRED